MDGRLLLALVLSFAVPATAFADPPRRLTAASPIFVPKKPVRSAVPPAPVVVPPSSGMPATGSAVRFEPGYRVTDPLGRKLDGNGRGWELSPDGSQWRGTGTNFGRSCPSSPPGGSTMCW
jgi:hypothetical protein